MKQHITVEQLQELTEVQKERLKEWWRPRMGDWYYYPVINHSDICATSLIADLKRMKKHYYPLLSIGQCIELLGERIYRIAGPKSELEILFPEDKQWWVGANTEKRYNDYFNADELIDALWQAVKEVL